MDRIFKPPFYERRYIASAPSLSSTAELSKSCGLVKVLDGRGAFGMNLIAWSQNMTPESAKAAGAILVSKEQLFARADRRRASFDQRVEEQANRRRGDRRIRH